jgi:lipopolysaccharide transport protein LptA
MSWQKRARIVIALGLVAGAAFVAWSFKGRDPEPSAVSLIRTDPKAVVESTGGRVVRFNRAQEEVRVEYERQLTYADGSTTLLGVKVSTDDRGGRSFTASGREGQLTGQGSSYRLDGDVRLAASDGFVATTEHATYSDEDAVVRAPGHVEFSRGRVSGSGLGMTYDKNADMLAILDHAVVRVAPDAKGRGSATIEAGSAFFDRGQRLVQFDRGVTVRREGQVVEAARALARLSEDEQRIDTLELFDGARIGGAAASPGGLRQLTGRQVTLQYAEDGQTLRRALVDGDGVVQLAGEADRTGSEIAARLLDIALAPDGSMPVGVVGREAVRLALPAEGSGALRTIRAAELDASGEAGHGLRRARFVGNVEYREKGTDVDRLVRSARLDLALEPGGQAIEEARFSGGTRFADTRIAGTAASMRYLPDAGALELSGTEPAMPVPRVSSDRLSVEATRIDVTLEGPVLRATGHVKSVIQPPGQAASDDPAPAKLPSMLKEDQAVNVTADAVTYDGASATTTYSGGAQLWQDDTSVRADSITIDDAKGDLSAAGSVTTATMLVRTRDDGATERERLVGTAREFAYEEALRRATYTGDAHLSDPQGDLTASSIRLYLTQAGDELDRAEADGPLTLREQSRRTEGQRLTYTSSNETYVVTGAPVTIIDECGRETTGATLTFVKGTDSVVVDGDERIRTRTRGGENCR